MESAETGLAPNSNDQARTSLAQPGTIVRSTLHNITVYVVTNFTWHGNAAPGPRLLCKEITQIFTFPTIWPIQSKFCCSVYIQKKKLKKRERKHCKLLYHRERI